MPEIYYHLFTVRMAATQNTRFDTWLGTYIRNNLLYAAEQIPLRESGLSLREFLNKLPLTENHPDYNALKNGFPKGYSLFLNSHNCPQAFPFQVKKGELITFTIALVGRLADCFPFVIEAVRLLCCSGMGNPVKPFILVDVCETHPSGQSSLVASRETTLASALQLPVRPEKTRASLETNLPIVLYYLSPMQLIKPGVKKNPEQSYLDKQNGFPGFYQLVRSAFNRYEKLSRLYGVGSFEETDLDTFLEPATRTQLEWAEIQQIQLPALQKKEEVAQVYLSGYIGNLSFYGPVTPYLPLLNFMQYLGVGNGMVYGLGQFRIIENNEK